MTGLELKQLREDAGLTLRQLVKMLKFYGVDGWKVFRWENGNHKIPARWGYKITSILKDHVRWHTKKPDVIENTDRPSVSPPAPSAPIKKRAGKARRNSNITLGDIIELAEADYRTSTTLLKFFGRYKRAEQLTSADLADYVKERRWMPDWVVHRELSFLAHGYELALRKGLVTKRLLIAGECTEDFFTHDQYERQLAVLKDYARDITRFAYITGWKQDAIFGLRWDSHYDSQTPAMCYEGRVFPLVGDLCDLIEERKNKRIDGCPWIFHHEGHQLVKWPNKIFRELQRAAAVNLRVLGYEANQVIMLTGHTKPVHVSYRCEIVAAEQSPTERPAPKPVAGYADTPLGN